VVMNKWPKRSERCGLIACARHIHVYADTRTMSSVLDLFARPALRVPGYYRDYTRRCHASRTKA
jgi:hypothetical protein